jgi:hypothetical protein
MMYRSIAPVCAGASGETEIAARAYLVWITDVPAGLVKLQKLCWQIAGRTLTKL